MVLPLAKLRQVPPLLKAALKARSITTCDQVLAVAGRCDDRAALARAARIAPDQRTELVRRADLARVNGVGTVFGRMLEVSLSDLLLDRRRSSYVFCNMEDLTT